MNDFIIRTLVMIFLNGSLILGLSLVATKVFGLGAASQRHHILFVSLICLAIFTPLFMLLPGWNLPQEVMPLQISETLSALNESTSQTESNFVESFANSQSGSEEESLVKTFMLLLPLILLSTWALGTITILILQLVRWAGAGFVASVAKSETDKSILSTLNSIRQQLGIKKTVALLRSDMAAVSMAWGIKKPCIVLPQNIAGWSDERISSVLLHEMAHIQRSDNFIQLLSVIICALFWFNPLVWIVIRQLHLEREVACDDQVINSGILGESYAKHLLEISQLLAGPKNENIIPAVMAHSSNMKKRLLSILNPKVNRRTLKMKTAIINLTLIILFALPIAAFQPWKAEANIVSSSEPSPDILIFTGIFHSKDSALKDVATIEMQSCIFDHDNPLDFSFENEAGFLKLYWQTDIGTMMYHATRGSIDGKNYRKYLKSEQQQFSGSDLAKFNDLLKRVSRTTWVGNNTTIKIYKDDIEKSDDKNGDDQSNSKSKSFKSGAETLRKASELLEENAKTYSSLDGLLDAVTLLKDVKMDSKDFSFDIVGKDNYKYSFSSAEGYVVFEEKTKGKLHHYEIRNNPNENETRIFTIDGEHRPFTKYREKKMFKILIKIAKSADKVSGK